MEAFSDGVIAIIVTIMVSRIARPVAAHACGALESSTDIHQLWTQLPGSRHTCGSTTTI
jgi:uncharacterized membrane protein